MTSPPAYLNAFVDRDELVCLYRTDEGQLRQTRRPAEYVSYFRASDLVQRVEFDRMLRSSRAVQSLTPEGAWLRVQWQPWRVQAPDATGRMRWYVTRDRICRGRDSAAAQHHVPTYEADVSPVLRHMVDTGATIQRPRRAYFDLETDSRVGWGVDRAGVKNITKARVLSWALVDDAGTSRWGVLAEDTDAAEAELLTAFWEAAEPYDQLCAWNGAMFDFVVLEARTQRLRLPVEPRRWLWLDQMEVYRRLNTGSESGDEKTSLKLQDVAMALLGEGKNDFDASQTWEAWAAGGAVREEMVRYNVQDTDLLRRIEAKNGFCELAFTLADACGVFPDTRGLNPTVQVESFLLRLGAQQGEHFQTRPEVDPEAERFQGAYVLAPSCAGLTRNVHVADFARLYPSIILTWNISPETKRLYPVEGPLPEGCARSLRPGVAFDTRREGILPRALRELIRLRALWAGAQKQLPAGSAEWEAAGRKSTAYKVAANSYYGVVGSPYSRFYDPDLAESVTLAGKDLILTTQAAAEQRGMRVVYADTDSIFVVGVEAAAFVEFVAWCNADLYPARTRDFGCTTHDIQLAYEKEFELIVFTAKKRYAAKLAHYKGQRFDPEKPRYEIKGLEYKRGDTARLARQFQEEAIHLLMAGETDLDTYRAVVAGWQRRVLTAPLTVDECAIRKRLQKELPFTPKEVAAMHARAREKLEAAGQSVSDGEIAVAVALLSNEQEGGYKLRLRKDGTRCAPLAHVQVAMEMKDRGTEVHVGTKVGYVVMDGSESPARVISAEDYVGECDRHYLWEKLVWPPTARLLEAAFPGAGWDAAWGTTRPELPAAAGRTARRRAVAQAAAAQVDWFPAAAPPASEPPPPPAGPLRLYLPADDASPERWDQLRETLSRFPGGRRVEVALWDPAHAHELVVGVDLAVGEDATVVHYLDRLGNLGFTRVRP